MLASAAMKAGSTIFLLYPAWLIGAVMLVFAAAEKQPDNFYTLLRWVCCAVFAYSAVTSFQMKRMVWLCIFAALAALFNPIFPLPLSRGDLIRFGPEINSVKASANSTEG
ncbi:MAG: hypothetical protein DME62_05730 [Verrucomicrobia bacterium]|nr:MAG: hypothetical protein DME62_05730 [Verrucomicrobiota bacterium]